MKLSEAVELFLDAQRGVLRPRTVEWYETRLPRLVAALGDVALAEVTLQQLRRWRGTLPAEFSPHTRRGYLRAVKRLFNWLVAEGYLAESPAERLRLPQAPDNPPKAVTPEDLAKLLACARETAAREYALVCVLADTGCRVGGLLSMRREALDLERGEVEVTEKGGRRRKVFFVEETCEALRAYLEEGPRKGPLWLGIWGPLTANGIHQALRRLGKKAGIEGRCNPHAFRHAFARECLRNGADLATVSQLMGHRSIEVTAQFYARWDERERKERHARFSPLARREGPAED